MFCCCAAGVASQDATHVEPTLRHYDVVNSTTRRHAQDSADDYADDAVDTSGYAAIHCYYYLYETQCSSTGCRVILSRNEFADYISSYSPR